MIRSRLSPLTRIFFRQSQFHLFRTVLLIFGIALGVAGVVAIDVAKTSVSKSFDLSFAAITSRSTHQITGPDFKIPQSIFTDLRTRLGIYRSAPVISAHVKVRELGMKTLTLMGIDPFSETYFRDITIWNPVLDTGRTDMSSLLSRPAGLLISRSDAAVYGVDPGDTITLMFGGRNVRVNVAGFLDSGDTGTRRMFQGLVVMDISFAQEILNMGDAVSRIDLILDGRFGTGVEQQVEQIRQILPANAFVVETNRQNRVIRQMSQSFETSLTAFSMLALFMGIFLIYNTVSFSVAQRRKLNGILRALGATKNNIFKTVISEVMVYALIGTVLGIILGILLGNAAVKVVAGTVSDIFFVLTVSQTDVTELTVLKGFLAGILSAFAAAFFPAWNAALTRPVTLMRRSASETGIRNHLPVLTFLGFSIVGITALALIQIDIHPGYDFLSVFMIFFGSAFLAPCLIIYGVAALRKMTAGQAGVLTRMAMGNVARSLSRTSVLVASLAVVTSVYIGVDIMTHSFRMSIIDWVDGNIGGDIHVASTDELNRSLDKSVLGKIEQMPSVSDVSAYNIHRVFSRSSGEVHIFSYIKDLSVKQWVWTAASPENLAGRLDREWIFVSEIFARKNKVIPGPDARVEIETQKGIQSFRIAGIFRDFFMGGGRVIISRDAMETYFGYTDITAMQIFLHPDQAIEPVMEAVASLFPETAMVEVKSGRSIKKSILDVFDNTFLITSALQILTAVVALTGILNSVMALLLERTRELGILRACGAEKRQLGRLLLTECGVAGLLSGIMALPLGGYLAWILIEIINKRSFGWSYDMVVSGWIFAQALVLSISAAVIAGVFPVVRAGKTDIGNALRME